MKGAKPKGNGNPANNSNSTGNGNPANSNNTTDTSKKDNTGEAAHRNYAKVFDFIYAYCLKVLKPFVVAFINTIFQVTHPLDSLVDFLDTSSIGENFDRLYSDSYIRITEIANGVRSAFEYAVEFQTYYDYNIGFRLFEYGGRLARDSKPLENNVLSFQYPPAAGISLWGQPKETKPIIVSTTGQNGQLNQPFVANIISFFSRTYNENVDGLFLLLPFEILRHRKELTTNPTDANVDSLLKEYQTIIDTFKKKSEGFPLPRSGFCSFANALNYLFVNVYSDLPQFQKGGKYEMTMADLQASYNLIDQMATMEQQLQDKDVELSETKSQLSETKSQLSEKDALIATLMEENRQLKASPSQSPAP